MKFPKKFLTNSKIALLLPLATLPAITFIPTSVNAKTNTNLEITISNGQSLKDALANYDLSNITFLTIRAITELPQSDLEYLFSNFSNIKYIEMIIPLRTSISDDYLTHLLAECSNPKNDVFDNCTNLKR